MSASWWARPMGGYLFHQIDAARVDPKSAAICGYIPHGGSRGRWIDRQSTTQGYPPLTFGRRLCPRCEAKRRRQDDNA